MTRHRAVRLASGILALSVLAWAAGLLWFVLALPTTRTLPEGVRVDGIVVFTGSAGRLDAGLEMLKANRAGRMLVSGVDPDLATRHIRPAIAAEDALFDCCIDLGRSARNTAGNAEEAVAWARAHGFRSLALVTADWHMRRSLAEFRRFEHGLALHPVAVESKIGAWRMQSEYAKFLYARLRALLTPRRPAAPFRE